MLISPTGFGAGEPLGDAATVGVAIKVVSGEGLIDGAADELALGVGDLRVPAAEGDAVGESRGDSSTR